MNAHKLHALGNQDSCHYTDCGKSFHPSRVCGTASQTVKPAHQRVMMLQMPNKKMAREYVHFDPCNGELDVSVINNKRKSDLWSIAKRTYYYDEYEADIQL